MWYEVWVDGKMVSEHETREEAFEEFRNIKEYEYASIYKCMVARTKVISEYK